MAICWFVDAVVFFYSIYKRLFKVLSQYFKKKSLLGGGNLGPFPPGRHVTTNQHPSPSDSPLKQGWRRAPKKRSIHAKGQGKKDTAPHYADLEGKVVGPSSFTSPWLRPVGFSLHEYPPLLCLLTCPSFNLLLQSPPESHGRLYYWSIYSPPLPTGLTL